MNGIVEWIIFLSLSTLAIVTAAGMLLTMSMYRAGLALMASFVALAGLFILLNADLLAAIQIMMNVGGMLVMVLFMVMIMMDPGGEMMWDMKREMHMPGLAAFSMHMPWHKPSEENPSSEKTAQATDWTCPMHPEVSQSRPGNCPKCGMSLIARAEEEQPLQDHVNETQTYTCPMHPQVQQNHPGNCPQCSMQLIEVEDTSQSHEAHGHQDMAMAHSAGNSHAMNMEMAGDEMENMEHPIPMSQAADNDRDQMQMLGHDMHMADMSKSDNEMNMSGMTPRQYYEMMVDMAMSTAQLPWAIALGIASALLLIVLVIQTPWPLSPVGPTQDATKAVGELLLSRYMIAFEGAAFLILAGIAGAVILGKREPPPMPQMQMQTSEPTEADTHMYTCPMHPEVREPHPDKCPKCGMNVLPVEEAPTSSNQSTQGGHL